MEKWVSLARRIDTVSDVSGRVLSFLLIPMMIITVTEVVMRYVFNSPTIWAWDLNLQLFGLLIIFGGPYAHRHEGHVRVDLLIAYLSPRGRAILDLITSILFFFSFAVLLFFSSQEALNSFATKERFTSFWAPPVYPLKMMIPVAILLFILQGVAVAIRNVVIIVQPEEAA